MLEHCDFDEQVSTTADEGRLRPDMIVHMPGGGEIVVDAKVPLDAFLKLIDADDDAERAVLQAAHARQLRTHVDQLAKKEYWKQFDAVTRSRWWPSSPATSCCPPPTSPTPRCRSTPWPTASC